MVDQRSDIFSFGLILYEMISGIRAFKGDSAVETMNAILKEDPTELTTTRRNISPMLQLAVLQVNSGDWEVRTFDRALRFERLKPHLQERR